MTRPPVAAAAALLLLGLLPASVAAASPTFGTPTASAVFGTSITFSQAFESPVSLARVEVLLTFPDSIGPVVAQAAGALAAGPRKLTFTQNPATDWGLLPNTPVVARWRLVPADRSLPPAVGPPVQVVYADTRFAWKSLEGLVIRLHWYEGSDAFARETLSIGEKAVRAAADFMGVTQIAPIDFFVYATESAFYDALGPGVRGSIGAQADPSTRTVLSWIAPDAGAIQVAALYVPHEITHLVFNSAVRNPYHFPPRWFNEGVAVYLSQGNGISDRGAVLDARDRGILMPLTALGGLFPTSAEHFSLAYSESVSAVDYLVRTNGTAALVKLIRSYAGGVTDDEAFTAALGTDVAGFQAAWLADLHADPPTRHGPQPAPPGPLPAGWESVAASSAPGGSPAPSAIAPGAPTSGGGSPIPDGIVLLVAALAGLLLGGSIAYVRRRRARTAAGGTSS